MDTEDDYVDELVSKAGPMKPDDEAAEGESEGDDAAYNSAVSDFMTASKSGDKAKAAAALKDAIRYCKM